MLLAQSGSRLAVSEADAREAYQRAPNSIAGIWSSGDGNYRLAVVPAPDHEDGFAGVILATRSPAWAPGQIKFNLAPDGRAIWRMGDHTEEPASAIIAQSTIRFPEVGIILVRDYPEPLVERDRLIPANEFFLRRLSSETLWLRLPDFDMANREIIEALLAQHDAAIRSTPNLIVDVRNNGGGADSSYDKLMSYLYTRPIYSIGAEVRNSRRNIDHYTQLAASPDLPPDSQEFLAGMAKRLAASDEEWVALFPRGFIITTYPEKMPYPQQVGIIGTGAGSTGDQFVMDARFSLKVTTFGGPTAGVIDYSNVSEAALPSGNGYVLHWPTTRSQRLPEEPLDNVGVPADVPFGPETDDPVGAAQEWLEARAR